MELTFSVQLEEVGEDLFDSTAQSFSASVKIGEHVIMQDVFSNAERVRGTKTYAVNADVALAKVEERFISRFMNLIDWGVTE